MKKYTTLLVGFVLSWSAAPAQTNINFATFPADMRGIERIETTTEVYAAGQKLREIQKNLYLHDTSGILLREETTICALVDTGCVRTALYTSEYSPISKLGTIVVENFPNPQYPRQSDYKKQTMRYRSYDHKKKNEWEETRDGNGKFLSERRYTFNHKGEPLSSLLREARADGEITQEDIFERNMAGFISRWSATDTENGKTSTTRNITYSYLSDTLLLRQEGYSYHNWREVDNKYDKNLQLTQSTTQTGYRQDGGKILRDSKTTTTYKDGKAQKIVFQQNGKTISTTVFSSPAPHTYIEKTSRKEGKKTLTDTKITTETFDAQNRITRQSVQINGVEKERQLIIYEGDRLIRYEFSTWEGAADALKEQKQVYLYDARGYPQEIQYYLDNQLTRQSKSQIKLYAK